MVFSINIRFVKGQSNTIILFYKCRKSNAENHIREYNEKHNLMIYMIPKIITVGHIFGNSVILTVVQKTIRVGATGENKKRF